MGISGDHHRIISVILNAEGSPPERTSLPRTEELARIVNEALVRNTTEITGESLRDLGTQLHKLDVLAYQGVQELLGICVSASEGIVNARIELALRRYGATQDLDVFQDLFAQEPPVGLEEFKAALEHGPLLLSGIELIHNQDGHILALGQAESSQEGFKEVLFQGAQLAKLHGLSPKALANIVNLQQLDLNETALSEACLRDVVPHLTYCDISKLEGGLQSKLLAKLNPQKVQQLSIKSSLIKTEQLPQLPQCRKLICGGCKALKTLPDLPCCEELICWGCSSLEALPQLPECLKLDCSDCPKITTLICLPKCQELDCSSCEELTTLTVLDACIQLNCSECSHLSHLPALPHCQGLNCSECIHLTELPQLPLCEYLVCSSCPGLTTVPQLPECQELDCSNCSSLTELPETLPNCALLLCHDCPGLQTAQLPEIPLDAQVFSGSDEGFTSWKVPYLLVDQQPKDYLDQLGNDYLLANKPFPNVYYEEADGALSAAIDVGGVRRDLISRILRNLFKKAPEKGHLLRDDEFPLFTEGDELSFQTLGKVIGLCYRPSSSFTTGALFGEDAYRALAAIDRPIQKALALQCLHPDLEKILEGNPDVEDSVRNQARFFVESDPETDTTDTLEGFQTYFSEKAHRQALQQGILARLKQPLFSQRSQALELIATSMKSALGEEAWKELCQLSPPELKARIEGHLSAEAILASLEWETGRASPIEIENTQGYVKTWLENANIDQLRLFVRAVTSSNSLPIDGKITLKLHQRGKDEAPVAHTCFSTLDLSAQYENQDNFNDRLAYLIGQAEDGFQMG